MATLFGCLEVPAFTLQALLRAEPELRGAPVVLLDGAPPRGRVLLASPEARPARPGMSAARARGLCPGLVARELPPAYAAAAEAALLDAAAGFSPRVEVAEAGLVFLDVAGLGRLYPALPEIARGLRQAAQAVGLSARAGLGRTKLAARLAARAELEAALVLDESPAREAALLAPLPVAALEPSVSARAVLASWGVRTVGELARLEPAALGRRLGLEGALLARRARGEEDLPLAPRPEPERFEETVELDHGLVAVEPFLFVARPPLERLLERLRCRGLAAAGLALRLGLEPRGIDERALELAAPTGDAKALGALLRLSLERSPPPAPVTAITFVATPSAKHRHQLPLFGLAAPDPTALGLLLARLGALGLEAGSLLPEESWRPGAHRLVPFRPPPPPAPDAAAPAGAGASEAMAALRRLDPPAPLLVEERDGRPFRLDAEDPALRPLLGAVVAAAGPFRLAGEWWSAEPFDQERYELRTAAGVLCRVYRERATGSWHLEGVLD